MGGLALEVGDLEDEDEDGGDVAFSYYLFYLMLKCKGNYDGMYCDSVSNVTRVSSGLLVLYGLHDL